MRNLEEYTFFQLGFKSHLEKTGAVGGKLMEIGKFLKSTVVPRISSAASQFGQNLKNNYLPAAGKVVTDFGKDYLSSHGAPLIGGAAGFTAAQNVYRNLSQGEELSKEKFVDDLIENVKLVAPIDVGLFAAGKAMGGMGNVYKAIKAAISGNKKIIEKAMSPTEIQELNKAISVAAKAGKDIVKGKPTEAAIDMIGYLPHVGAAAGALTQYDPENPISSTAKGAVGGALAGKGLQTIGRDGLTPHLPTAGALAGMYTEYDPDAPVSSLARGGIGGAVIGKGIGMIPSVSGPKTNLANSFLDSLQLGLGMEATSAAIDRKAKRTQEREMKKYYQSLQERMQLMRRAPNLQF